MGRGDFTAMMNLTISPSASMARLQRTAGALSRPAELRAHLEVAQHRRDQPLLRLVRRQIANGGRVRGRDRHEVDEFRSLARSMAPRVLSVRDMP
ncbi:MAG: hypothetical protein R2706_05420 [Acidimicrobiales bacterium]